MARRNNPDTTELALLALGGLALFSLGKKAAPAPAPVAPVAPVTLALPDTGTKTVVPPVARYNPDPYLPPPPVAVVPQAGPALFPIYISTTMPSLAVEVVSLDGRLVADVTAAIYPDKTTVLVPSGNYSLKPKIGGQTALSFGASTGFGTGLPASGAAYFANMQVSVSSTTQSAWRVIRPVGTGYLGIRNPSQTDNAIRIVESASDMVGLNLIPPNSTGVTKVSFWSDGFSGSALSVTYAYRGPSGVYTNKQTLTAPRQVLLASTEQSQPSCVLTLSPPPPPIAAANPYEQVYLNAPQTAFLFLNGANTGKLVPANSKSPFPLPVDRVAVLELLYEDGTKSPVIEYRPLSGGDNGKELIFAKLSVQSSSPTVERVYLVTPKNGELYLNGVNQHIVFKQGEKTPFSLPVGQPVTLQMVYEDTSKSPVIDYLSKAVGDNGNSIVFSLAPVVLASGPMKSMPFSTVYNLAD